LPEPVDTSLEAGLPASKFQTSFRGKLKPLKARLCVWLLAVHMTEQPVQQYENQDRRETTAAELIRSKARDKTAHWTLHENTSSI
jgi:hypothetical protein